MIVAAAAAEFKGLRYRAAMEMSSWYRCCDEKKLNSSALCTQAAIHAIIHD